jgi:hypothetical protein
MDSFQKLVARGRLAVRASDDNPSELMINVMIALLVLVFVGLTLLGTLIILRRMKQTRQAQLEVLPRYSDVKRSGNHRRLTIQTGDGRQSILVIKDGQPMLSNPSSPPHSPDNVPQIHITFPDEHDDSGRRKSGRVVVVRVGDTTIGMEPPSDEQLPAYEKDSKTQFYSIDMDRIGGLKEKDRSDFH